MNKYTITDDQLDHKLQDGKLKSPRAIDTNFTANVMGKITEKQPHKLILKLSPAYFVAAITAFVLLMGGGAYAAVRVYQASTKIDSVKRSSETLNPSSIQTEAGIQVFSCGDKIDGSIIRMASTQELTGDEITQAQHMVENECERAQASAIATQITGDSTLGVLDVSEPGQPYKDAMIDYTPYIIESVSGSALKIFSPEMEQIYIEENLSTETTVVRNTLELPADAKIYINGELSDIGSLKVGDRVFTVTSMAGIYPGSKTDKAAVDSTKQTIAALIKANWYTIDRSVYGKVFKLDSCRGNVEALCPAATGGTSNALIGVDIITQGIENLNTDILRSDIKSPVGQIGTHEVFGTVTDYNADSLTIESFGEKITYIAPFSFTNLKNRVNELNTYYSGTKPEILTSSFGIGSKVGVIYLKAPSENSKQIELRDTIWVYWYNEFTPDGQIVQLGELPGNSTQWIGITSPNTNPLNDMTTTLPDRSLGNHQVVGTISEKTDSSILVKVTGDQKQYTVPISNAVIDKRISDATNPGGTKKTNHDLVTKKAFGVGSSVYISYDQPTNIDASIIKNPDTVSILWFYNQ